MDIWNVLGIIAIILLLISFGIGKNAIWGTLTMGIVIGLIAGLVYLIKGDGFNWQLFKRIVIISVLLGGVFEIIGRLRRKPTT